MDTVYFLSHFSNSTQIANRFKATVILFRAHKHELELVKTITS